MSRFDPSAADAQQMLAGLEEQLLAFLAARPTAPAVALDGGAELGLELAAWRPGGPRRFAELLAVLERAAATAIDTAGPGYLAYIPGGGLWATGLADLWSDVVNRYLGFAEFAPALVGIETSVIGWLTELFDLPPTAGGVLTSGGSQANFGALVAARHQLLGDDLARGTLYVSPHTHRSVAKAARLAGLPADAVRLVAVTQALAMDPVALASAVRDDRAQGRRPFLVVASAGTTDTGTVDPLPELAGIAADAGLWLHVDAAYGGFFQLTERGRARFSGIERADSITLDPHKALFLSYGTGCLLVRDEARLRAAHAGEGDYLQDVARGARLPDFADLSGELTRPFRGLRVWLPLHLYGLEAFRVALDEVLDLAQRLADGLRADPRIELAVEPELSVVAFRLREGDDAANQTWLARINDSRRVYLSSTRIEGRFTLRACVLSHRTDRARIEEAIEIIRATAP